MKVPNEFFERKLAQLEAIAAVFNVSCLMCSYIHLRLNKYGGTPLIRVPILEHLHTSVLQRCLLSIHLTNQDTWILSKDVTIREVPQNT